MKINGIKLNAPLKTKIAVYKANKSLEKAGNKNISILQNKRGDVALLAYDTPEHDELVVSQIIRADGTETMSFYKKYPLQGFGKPYMKIVETWDKHKNDLTFNKQTTFQYNGYSKVPEVISTMYTDKDTCDGVEIVKKYPFSVYSKIFQRPETEE